MRLLGAGDNVVDRYAQLRTQFPGGNAVNVAVFASRIGARAAYMGLVGSDVAGQRVLASLRAEGVDTSLVCVGHKPNAHADVELVGDDRVFRGSVRTGALFDLNHEQLEAMRRYDIVHSGYAGTLLPRVPEMAARSRISFDFGSRYAFGEVSAYLEHLYLASFSAAHLSAGEAQELALEAVHAGATYSLATRGGEGAYLATADGVVFQEADIITAVDTLGAGDAYIASVLVGLSAHRDPAVVMASASAHAAQVCLQHGAFGHGFPYVPARSSLPTMTTER